MRKHKVSPLESIEIDFRDRKLIFTFDMLSINKLQNEFGALEKIAQEKSELELAGIILWSGIKDIDLTVEEAQVIICSDAMLLKDVLDVTFDSIIKIGGKENEKKLLEEIEKIIKKMKLKE